MSEIVYFNSVSDYNDSCGVETLHPLISILDLSKCPPRDWKAGKKVKMNFGIYAVFLKDVKCGDIRYGLDYYDYQEETFFQTCLRKSDAFWEKMLLYFETLFSFQKEAW